MSESVEELLHDIWVQLVDRNVMQAMRMLKDQTVMYSREQRAYLEGIVAIPFTEEDEAPPEA